MEQRLQKLELNVQFLKKFKQNFESHIEAMQQSIAELEKKSRESNQSQNSIKELQTAMQINIVNLQTSIAELDDLIKTTSLKQSQN